MSKVKGFFAATVNECPGPLGGAILLFALAGPVLLGLGLGMFALHQPHLSVEWNATLYAVQNDRWNFNLVMPETYSWCVYALQVNCPNFDSPVNAWARRDDFAYNGLSRVETERCFNDAEKVNEPSTGGDWDAESCLDADGLITCTDPRPIIRAWYKPSGCGGAAGDEHQWTLNDPAITIPRFTAFTVAGAVLTLLGCGGMCCVFVGKGCPGGDEYL
jgi:hypothetical protein